MKREYSLILRLLFAITLISFSNSYTWIITKISLILSYLQLKLFFNSAILNDNLIILGERSIEYVSSCAAVGAYMFLAILIFFTGGIALRKGLHLFFVGSLLIFLANLIRIDILAYLLVNENINLFIGLHLFTWKMLSGIYVALVWIFLVKKYKIKEIPIVGDYNYLKKLLF
jgi:exosortase/archaeosortase family protein